MMTAPKTLSGLLLVLAVSILTPRSCQGLGVSWNRNPEPTIPPHKPNRFGGFKKSAKLIYEALKADNMASSVNFRPKGGNIYSWQALTYCFDCISINGSYPACESLFHKNIRACWTSAEKPYCSVEYGVLSDNQTFVRRTCQDRRCVPCSGDDGLAADCHTFQCDLCSGVKCNDGGVQDVFRDDWKGCAPSSDNTSHTFEPEYRCEEPLSTFLQWVIALAVLAIFLLCCCCCSALLGRSR